MNRIALILLVALTVGCATTRPEEVDGMGLEQQLNAYIDEYYDEVVDLCIEMHGKASLGQTGIDCAVRGNAMHVSFPSILVHNQDAIYESTRQLEANWCSAAQSKTGKVAHWVRHFRRDGKTMSRPCFKGEQLRRLMEATKHYGQAP